MKKSLTLVLGLFVVVFIAGCGNNQQASSDSKGSKGSHMEEAQKSVSDATDAIAKEAQAAKKEAEEAAAKAKAAAEAELAAAKQEAEKAAAELKKVVDGLVAKAKSALDAGKFEEAIAKAKEALAKDSTSQEAKNIITQAKEKLAALANEQVDGLKAGINDKLKSFGQEQ